MSTSEYASWLSDAAFDAGEASWRQLLIDPLRSTLAGPAESTNGDPQFRYLLKVPWSG
jgi:hypothetical protein